MGKYSAPIVPHSQPLVTLILRSLLAPGVSSGRLPVRDSVVARKHRNA